MRNTSFLYPQESMGEWLLAQLGRGQAGAGVKLFHLHDNFSFYGLRVFNRYLRLRTESVFQIISVGQAGLWFQKNLYEFFFARDIDGFSDFSGSLAGIPMSNNWFTRRFQEVLPFWVPVFYFSLKGNFYLPLSRDVCFIQVVGSCMLMIV